MTDRKKLTQAYAHLSHRYRHTADKKGLRSNDEALAYVQARMPATRACVLRCLDELPQDYHPKTVLDVGAGPGTATSAIKERFSNVSATLIEDDKFMLDIGKNFCPSDQWIPEKLTPTITLPQSDLVVLSYVLNELPESDIPKILENLWSVTQDYLILITPGTPAAFQQLRQARSHLISLGATVIAPCPHQFECPMMENDWCHFRVRVSRSAEHRKIKGGDLGYEDEKYSYLILSRHTNGASYSRVTKPPQHRSGHGSFEVCAPTGQLQTITYSKSKSADFKTLKNLEWGDILKKYDNKS